MIQGVTDMWLIAFLMFFVSFSVFAYIMIREPRTLWSGNSFSALRNLIHLKRRRNADYIAVLGAGIIGTRVTPLLGARIDKELSF